jgi:hypothetical protein
MHARFSSFSVSLFFFARISFYLFHHSLRLDKWGERGEKCGPRQGDSTNLELVQFSKASKNHPPSEIPLRQGSGMPPLSAQCFRSCHRTRSRSRRHRSTRQPYRELDVPQWVLPLLAHIAARRRIDRIRSGGVEFEFDVLEKVHVAHAAAAARPHEDNGCRGWSGRRGSQTVAS